MGGTLPVPIPCENGLSTPGGHSGCALRRLGGERGERRERQTEVGFCAEGPESLGEVWLIWGTIRSHERFWIRRWI